MKYLMMSLLALSSSNSFAANIEGVAFERLNYEVSKSTSNSESTAIALYYFDVLNRIGTAPRNRGMCFSSILGNAPSAMSCLSPGAKVVNEGGGTGGVD